MVATDKPMEMVRAAYSHAGLILAGLFLLALPVISQEAARPPANAVQIALDGAVTPASAHYIVENIEQAATEQAALVLLTMDTPGGLDSSMRTINRAILDSPVPVVTFVWPKGSRAASAGTYILYASHIAAMSPATNLGAATPVQIGGPSPAPEPADEEAPEGEDTEEQQKSAASGGKTAMEKKVINDASAYLRGLAELRGRNAEWAEQAVREGVSLTAEEALEIGVIDLIAENPEALLQQLDGREIAMDAGTLTLSTKDLAIEVREPDWKIRLLSIITDPNVAYILMLLGIYGLIFEGYNPGAFVPGIAGAICLLLALYAFQVLPINFTGIALLVLGIGLMVAEAFAPSFGALGIGGLIAFVIGSFMLFDKAETGLSVAWPLILGVAIASAILLTTVLGFALRARRKPVVSGRAEMKHLIGEVISDFDHEGPVRIRGEVWQARSLVPLQAGQRVRVVAIDGLVLQVTPEV